MFNFIKSATCAPQIATGTGIHALGNGIISVGNVVAGCGTKLQASGWLRKITLANVCVFVVNQDGTKFVDGAGDPVKGEQALFAHFTDPAVRVKFAANDPNNAVAVQKATAWSQEFDQRTIAAGIQISQPTQPKVEAKEEKPAATEAPVSQMLSAVPDDALEC